MAFNYNNNNNNNNSYVGPWYEQTGPDAKYVRDDIYCKFKNNLNKINNKELETILLQNIPDSKTDFGSWRGYATFGIEEKIYDRGRDSAKDGCGFDRGRFRVGQNQSFYRAPALKVCPNAFSNPVGNDT